MHKHGLSGVYYSGSSYRACYGDLGEGSTQITTFMRPRPLARAASWQAPSTLAEIAALFHGNERLSSYCEIRDLNLMPFAGVIPPFTRLHLPSKDTVGNYVLYYKKIKKKLKIRRLKHGLTHI